MKGVNKDKMSTVSKTIHKKIKRGTQGAYVKKGINKDFQDAFEKYSIIRSFIETHPNDSKIVHDCYIKAISLRNKGMVKFAEKLELNGIITINSILEKYIPCFDIKVRQLNN